MQNNLSLEDIIDLKSFQQIQDDIANATGVAIIIVDYKGKPITNHSNCTKFCKEIRNIREYSMLCEKCDSRGGLEAVRKEEEYIYKCHCGLIDFAVPIIVNNNYFGALMAGQVLLDEDNTNLESLLNVHVDLSSIKEKYNKDLQEEYNNLTKLSLEKIQYISKMMLHLSDYIVKDALLKIKHKEIHKEIFEENINHPSYVKFNRNNEEESPISKAIEYIDDNIYEKISLGQVASICNLSECYFSKLFKKEMGINFNHYINERKIEKAKEILKHKTTSVNNIAIDLGYEDIGYFIRVFKKFTNMTPNQYRKS